MNDQGLQHGYLTSPSQQRASMRTSGSRPLPARVLPRQGACADLLPSRPSLSRDPGSLETRRRVPGGGALDSGVLLATLTGGWRPPRPVRTLWSPVRSRAGNASVPGERRPAAAGEDGGGHGVAASGRRPGLLHGRLPRSEAGIHRTWAGGGGSNCQHQRGVRGSPQSSPSPPQK